MRALLRTDRLCAVTAYLFFRYRDGGGSRSLSESRFAPRSFLTDASKFGHRNGVEWKPKNLASQPGWAELDRVVQLRSVARMRAEFLAAQTQHRACETIRSELKRWSPNSEQTIIVRDVFIARGKRGAGSASKTQRYAALTGNSYDRLVKMLRGEIIMRLEDMAIADVHLKTNLTGMRSEPSRR